MPSRELASGPVGSFDYDDDPIYDPAVVVGDAPQWGDTSDATYGESSGATGVVRSFPQAAYEAVPNITRINSLTVEGRYKTAYPSGTFPTSPPRSFGYVFRTDRLSTTPNTWTVTTFGSVGHPEAVNDNAVHDFTYQVFPQSWMTAEDVEFYEPIFRDLIAQGPLVYVSANSQRLSVTRPSTLTMYEFRLFVDYEVEENRKLRLYPRDDELGFGGVKRNYPPPRRRRNYGQQP